MPVAPNTHGRFIRRANSFAAYARSMPDWLLAATAGLLAGGALLVGAVVAWFVQVPRRIVAGIMAFGAGVLISALAFDLVLEAQGEGGFWPTVSGFAVGAVIYVIANRLLDRVRPAQSPWKGHRSRHRPRHRPRSPARRRPRVGGARSEHGRRRGSEHPRARGDRHLERARRTLEHRRPQGERAFGRVRVRAVDGHRARERTRVARRIRAARRRERRADRRSSRRSPPARSSR